MRLRHARFGQLMNIQPFCSIRVVSFRVDDRLLRKHQWGRLTLMHDADLLGQHRIGHRPQRRRPAGLGVVARRRHLQQLTHGACGLENAPSPSIQANRILVDSCMTKVAALLKISSSVRNSWCSRRRLRISSRPEPDSTSGFECSPQSHISSHPIRQRRLVQSKVASDLHDMAFRVTRSVATAHWRYSSECLLERPIGTLPPELLPKIRVSIKASLR